MISFDIIYRNLKLRIYCTNEYEKMIKDHLLGHVVFSQPFGKATYTLNISDDDNHKKGFYSKIIDKWFNYATADCYINDDICYLNNIKADSQENLTLLVQYFTANVFNRLLEIEGYFGLHSSCVEKKEKGIIFIGGRNSGKTACMLNMMNSGYNIVTNDKSAITCINNELIDYGIAQSVSIRLSKEFRKQKENKKYEKIALEMGISFVDENKLEGNNLILNDIELARINGVEQVKDTPIKLIINPVYNPYIETPKFRKLSHDETVYLVKSQLLPLVHETTLFLGNIKHNKDNLYSSSDTIEKLAHIPCYYCEQNEKTNELVIQKIKKIIK